MFKIILSGVHLLAALLIMVSAFLIGALGVYQKLSATIEKAEKENT